MPCQIFSNEAAVDKYRNNSIINIQIYSAVNKVRILFEDGSTLKSNISVIYSLTSFFPTSVTFLFLDRF